MSTPATPSAPKPAGDARNLVPAATASLSFEERLRGFWEKNRGTVTAVLVAILVVYVLLGCVMDSLAMILLTIPIFYPVVMGLDFYGLSNNDKSVWFGILALMVVEIGLVHPPVGMNLFIIQKLAKDVPYLETAKGVMPFLASDFIRIGFLVAFPVISLWLVRSM